MPAESQVNTFYFLILVSNYFVHKLSPTLAFFNSFSLPLPDEI